MIIFLKQNRKSKIRFVMFSDVVMEDRLTKGEPLKHFGGLRVCILTHKHDYW